MLLPLFLSLCALSGPLTQHLCAASGPTVNTVYGSVEGFSAQSAAGYGAEVFLGIPFAKPPVGNLRWKKPQAVEPWTGTLQAKAYGPTCSSFPAFFAGSSEDCLTLNIIKPANLSGNPKGYPVIVYIYGGGWGVGSGQDITYQAAIANLVSRDVILVTIQYRLGPFGFFTTGDNTAPGNYGLWDMVEALKFVRKTIGAFNGNKNDVTVLGQSAGSASISYLNLHSGANHLFKKSIAMSGSAGALFAQGESVKAMSDKLTELLHCDQAGNAHQKMACLRDANTSSVVGGFQSLIGVTGNNRRPDCPKTTYWHPRFDGDFVDAPNLEEAIRRSPARPYFMGLCSQEGIFFGVAFPGQNVLTKYLPLPRNVAQNFNETLFDDAVDKLYGTQITYGNDRVAAVNRILNFYKSTANYSRNFYLQTYFQIYSDIAFNVPGMREAQLKAKNGSPVYYYRYSHERAGQEVLADGVWHGGDLINFMGMPSDFSVPADYTTQQTFLDLLISFVKEDRPSSASNGLVLDKVRRHRIPFVDVNSQSVKYDDLWPERLAFWNDMRRDFNYDWPSGKKKGPNQVVQCPVVVA